MPDRWVADEDYPQGHLVAMTLAEEAQLETDQKACVAIAADLDKQVEAVAERLDALRKARTELSSGAIFSGLSASEQKVVDLLLQEATA